MPTPSLYFAPPLRWLRAPKNASMRLGVCVLVLLAACATSDGGAPSAPETPAASTHAGERVTPVRGVVVEETPFRDTVELVGFAQAARSAVVTTEIPGRILRLHAEEGERVSRGQVLAEVDVSSQLQQRTQIEAQLAVVQREIDRVERLIERGLGTEMNLDQLLGQRAVLQEGLRPFQSLQRQARTTAPMDGIVVERTAEPGELALPGAPLLRIVDHSEMIVRVGVPEGDIRYLQVGDTLRVLIDAIGHAVDGRVHRIAVEIDERNRAYPVELLVANADERIRAGMRARVRFERSRREAALVVPRDALVQRVDALEAVLAVGGRAQQRIVRTGASLGPYVVVEDGISAGDVLITRGQRGLVDGERVDLQETTPCCAEALASFLETRFSLR